jgi:hypothetical protein
MGRFFRAPEVGRHIDMPAFGVYLAHNIKPWVVCEERRDALLIRAIFLVSRMTVFDYGLECAHLSPMRDVALSCLSDMKNQAVSARAILSALTRENRTVSR